MGGFPNRDPLTDPPQTETPWTETPWIETPCTETFLDRDPPGHMTCDACWDRDPPPHEQNDTQV